MPTRRAAAAAAAALARRRARFRTRSNSKLARLLPPSPSDGNGGLGPPTDYKHNLNPFFELYGTENGHMSNGGTEKKAVAPSLFRLWPCVLKKHSDRI